MQEENRTLKKSNKTLKKKTILHKRKNKTLKKKAILHEREIARLRKSLEQKDKDLDLERSLWNGRKTEWDSGAGTDLHRIEVFDGIISDESSLHSATMRSMEEFKYILEHVKAYATAYNEMPLFCDDESRASDPGNRCKLRLRHALLLVLVRKKNNPAQGTLQANLRSRPKQRVQIPPGYGPDTGNGAFHDQKHLRGDNCVQDQRGVQEEGVGAKWR